MASRLALALGAGALLFGPIAACASTVNITGNFTGPFSDGGNEFIDEINAAFFGSHTFVDGASLFLNMPSFLTFTPVAAESSTSNGFVFDVVTNFLRDERVAGGLSEDSDFGEGEDFLDVNTSSVKTRIPTPTSLDEGLCFLINEQPNFSCGSATVLPGSSQFGVFLPGNAASGGSFSRLFLALEDQPNGDDDFDDFIVRVDVAPIPLPASGLFLIGAAVVLGLFGHRRARVA